MAATQVPITQSNAFQELTQLRDDSAAIKGDIFVMQETRRAFETQMENALNRLGEAAGAATSAAAQAQAAAVQLKKNHDVSFQNGDNGASCGENATKEEEHRMDLPGCVSTPHVP